MISLVFWGLALTALVVAGFYLIHLLLFAPRHLQPSVMTGPYPFVSLLKPLKGVNEQIRACAESFFRLDYDAFELIFAVDEEGDPAQLMVQDLMNSHSHVSCRVLVTGHSDRINPKIHKLMAMEEISSAGVLWVTDANVRVEPLTLKRLLSEMTQKKVKLLFSPIRGCGSVSFGSLIENSYINSFLSGNVIAAWKMLTHPIIVGKSILLEREALRQFGGFGFFKNFLAEDYVMGDSYRRSALPMGLSDSWIDNVNSHTPVGGCRDRLLRWAQLRFHIKPHVYLLEPVANPMFYAVAAFISGGFTHPNWLAAVLLLKILFELWGFHRLNAWGDARTRQIALFPLAVVVKDLLMVWIFIAPFFRHTVRWSGAPVRIGPQTRIGLQDWGLIDGL